MARWDDEDYWDDADEPEPRRAPRRPVQEEEFAPEPASDHRPIREEMEGAVYAISDPLWEFKVPDRDWHPGVCVRCDPRARLAFCCKGTDARRARLDRFAALIVTPSPQNGLEKTTAFPLDPHRLPLNILQKIHNSDGWRGSLEDVFLRQLQIHVDRFLARSGGTK